MFASATALQRIAVPCGLPAADRQRSRAGHLRRDDRHGRAGQPASGPTSATSTRGSSRCRRHLVWRSLPDRVVRAIVFARLANFLEGHAATTPRIALAVAAMLDGGPLPRRRVRPGRRRRDPGALSVVRRTRDGFRSRGQGARLADQRLALRRGAVADAALAARRRVRQAQRVFAFSIEAFGAPLEHYDRRSTRCGATSTKPRRCAACGRSRRRRREDGGTTRLPSAIASYRASRPCASRSRRCERAADRVARLGLRQPGLCSAGRSSLRPVPQHRRLPQRHGTARARRSRGDLGGSLPALRPAQRETGHRPRLAAARPAADRARRRAIATVTAPRLRADGGHRLSRAGETPPQRTFIPGTEPAARDRTTSRRRFFSPGQGRAGRTLRGQRDVDAWRCSGVPGPICHWTPAAPGATILRRVDQKRAAPVQEDRILGPELGSLAGWFTRALSRRLTQRLVQPKTGIDRQDCMVRT